MRERRLVARWNINYQAQVVFGLGKDFVLCQIKDINFKGMQLAVAENLEKDAFKKMTLMLSEDVSLEIEFWLAWVKKSGNQHIYGLYFTKVSDSDKDKIYKFVYQNFRQGMTKEWWKGLVKKEGVMEKNGLQDRRIFERIPVRSGRRERKIPYIESLGEIDIHYRDIPQEAKENLNNFFRLNNVSWWQPRCFTAVNATVTFRGLETDPVITFGDYSEHIHYGEDFVVLEKDDGWHVIINPIKTE